MSYAPAQKFELGLFGTLALLGALLVFLWVLTFQQILDIQLVITLFTASFFIVGGISLGYIMTGINFKPFSIQNFINTILSTILNVVVIYYLNRIVPIQFEFSGIPQAMLGVLVGVAEECFFRVFLCGTIYRMTKSVFIAVIASSGIWATYHIARYGASINILFLVFACGCVLGLTFLYTKSADGCIFGHAVVNYIALT